MCHQGCVNEYWNGECKLNNHQPSDCEPDEYDLEHPTVEDDYFETIKRYAGYPRGEI